MKKWLSIFVLLNFINFASAQGTISDLLNSVDPSSLIIYAVFLISFTLLFFSLNRVFKDNRTTSGIISAAIALLITYAVNKSGFDISGFFYNFGVSSEIFATIIPIIILLGTLFLIIKLAKNSLLVIGVLLIAGSFFVYEQTILVVIGIILIGIRFFIPQGKWEMKKPEKKS
ncbi:MAG: hypothetical protein AABX99_02675 [Nanoarchaeota archaeon]